MKVSVFGLGSWLTYGHSITDSHLIEKHVHAAYHAGINFFDLADVYANGEAERAVGRVLRDFPRSDLVISTKIFWPMSENVNDRGLSRKHILESIDKSLKRLGTDYIDLYFCHRYDTDTPLEETTHALDDLIHKGKILYWGTSEWSGDQLRTACQLCNEKHLYRPQVEQPQYSLLCRRRFETDVQPAAQESGMGLVTWSPLTYGILTGKYDQGIPDGARLQHEKWLRDRYLNESMIQRVIKMKTIADALGCTRAQLALAWTAAQPGISSVITGATRLEQLHENLGALSVDVSGEIDQQLKELFPLTD